MTIWQSLFHFDQEYQNNGFLILIYYPLYPLLSGKVTFSYHVYYPFYSFITPFPKPQKEVSFQLRFATSLGYATTLPYSRNSKDSGNLRWALPSSILCCIRIHEVLFSCILSFLVTVNITVKCSIHTSLCQIRPPDLSEKMSTFS